MGSRVCQGQRRQNGPQTETDRPPEARGDPPARLRRRAGARDRPQLQRQPQHDFTARSLNLAKMSQLPRWVSYTQALAVPIIAAVIAAFGAWIAACQMWIAREKLRLDAFDRQYNRRVAVYEATRTLLADVFHGNISEAEIRAYCVKTLDAQFLFDDNLQKFLNEVRNRVAGWRDADLAAQREPPGEQKGAYLRIRGEHLKWITDQGDQRFTLRFEPFLVYKPAKRPWYLRLLPGF
jgi:hypothetical protein